MVEGLCELGDLESGRFTPWESMIDESMDRVRSVYVEHFHDANVWPWYCWLDLTDAGQRVAATGESGRI